MSYFNSQEQENIKQAIQTAEHLSSGEIRVCIEKKCHGDPLHRAAYFFKKLKMYETQERNGILIYLAHEDQKFAIFGDQGIHSKIGHDFWDHAKKEMLKHFKSHKILAGVLEAIQLTGDQLKTYFPYISGKENELSDDIYDKG